MSESESGKLILFFVSGKSKMSNEANPAAMVTKIRGNISETSVIVRIRGTRTAPNRDIAAQKPIREFLDEVGKTSLAYTKREVNEAEIANFPIIHIEDVNKCNSAQLSKILLSITAKKLMETKPWQRLIKILRPKKSSKSGEKR